MASITDRTRNDVWRTLCDLEWNGRYYDALADQYQFRYLALRFGILGSVPVEGAILYFAVSYPWLFIAALVVGVVLGVLTVWDAVSNYAETGGNHPADGVRLRRPETRLGDPVATG